MDHVTADEQDRTIALTTTRPRGGAGFTLIEVVFALSILALVSLGLAAWVLQSQSMETGTRERKLVESSLFTRFQELRTLTSDEILAQDGTGFDVEAVTPVTQPPDGSPESVGPTFGDAVIVATATNGKVGSLTVREVDPTDPATASPGSEFFEVTARAAWRGVQGVQSMEVRSYVVSHADDD